MNNTITLEGIKKGFEEQKGIKILSLYFAKDNCIEGIYIVPPQQSLSFVKKPFDDIWMEFDGYNIALVELGNLLQFAYNTGSITFFDKLLINSAIDCKNNYFDELVNFCKNNPPLLTIKLNLIRWIEMTDIVSPVRTQSFLKQCKSFNKIDTLTYNVNLDIENTASVSNEFNYVKQQLKEKQYSKTTELVINKIDELFVKMQIDLYITDNK